eukprot:TRINITY_DN95309_c0_g1_i3.p2 TRINITY_DN95309_c0_g1~~TRINITY_DN95309_c0_g1_i3.p2  ORF type:complete len:117 (-),score=13.46 TRINITY_DN95309_c0_g1_i3:96-446(-)
MESFVCAGQQCLWLQTVCCKWYGVAARNCCVIRRRVLAKIPVSHAQQCASVQPTAATNPPHLKRVKKKCNRNLCSFPTTILSLLDLVCVYMCLLLLRHMLLLLINFILGPTFLCLS